MVIAFNPPIDPSEPPKNVDGAVEKATQNTKAAIAHEHQADSRFQVLTTLDSDEGGLATDLQSILHDNHEQDTRLKDLLDDLPTSDDAQEVMGDRITLSQKLGAEIASRNLQIGENARTALLVKLSKLKQDSLTDDQVKEFMPTLIPNMAGIEFLTPASNPALPADIQTEIDEYLLSIPRRRNIAIQLVDDEDRIRTGAEALGKKIETWANAQTPDDLPELYKGTNVATKVAIELQRVLPKFTYIQNTPFSNLSLDGIKGIMGEGLTERQRAAIFKNPRKIQSIVDGPVKGKFVSQTARIQVRISGQEQPLEFYGTGSELADQLTTATSGGARVINVRIKRDVNVAKAMANSESGVIFASKDENGTEILRVASTGSSDVLARRRKSVTTIDRDHLDNFDPEKPMAEMGYNFALQNTTKIKAFDPDPTQKYDRLKDSNSSSFQDIAL